MKTYKFLLEVEVSAFDTVEAGMFVGKALQDADDMRIIEFEEAE